MRTKRRLLLGTATATLLVAAITTRPAEAEVFDTAVLLEILAYLQTYVVPILEVLEQMPETLDGYILEATQEPIGDAINSYLTRLGPGRFAVLFPDDPSAFTADDASAYAIARNLDRKGRATEAMDTAAAVIADQRAASDRLTGFAVRNANPLESLEGVGKLGNQIAIEHAGSIKELTAITAEAAQLEADQRVQEDWQRRQRDAWERNHYGDSGYWTGERRWQPETMTVRW